MPDLQILKDDRTRQVLFKITDLVALGHPLVSLAEKMKEPHTRIDRGEQKDKLIFLGAQIAISLFLFFMLNALATEQTQNVCNILGQTSIFALTIHGLISTYISNKREHSDDFDIFFRLKTHWVQLDVEEYEWYEFLEKSLQAVERGFPNTNTDFTTILRQPEYWARWLNLFHFRDSAGFDQMFSCAFNEAYRQMGSSRWFSGEVNKYTTVLHSLTSDEREKSMSKEDVKAMLSASGKGKSPSELESLVRQWESLIKARIDNPYCPMSIRELAE